MRIFGTNDRATTTFRANQIVYGTCWKGNKRHYHTNKSGKEYPGAGSDLKNLFRLEISNRAARELLITECGGRVLPDPNKLVNPEDSAKNKGYPSIAVETLHIHFLFNKTDEAFPTSLKSWGKNRTLNHLCDRRHKTMVTKEEFDPISQRKIRKQEYPLEIAKQMPPDQQESYLKDYRCPVAGKSLSFGCPNGCSASGTLYFHIAEFVKSPLVSPFFTIGLTTSSREDIAQLVAQLDRIEQEYGSIGCYDFSIPEIGFQYRQNIPYILWREKDLQSRPRGNDRMLAEHWELRIAVDPVFAQRVTFFNEVKNAFRHGIIPTKESLAQFLRGRVPKVEYITIESASPPVSPALYGDVTSDPGEPTTAMKILASTNTATQEDRANWIAVIRDLQKKIEKRRELYTYENPASLETAPDETIIKLGRELRRVVEQYTDNNDTVEF